MTRRLMKTWTAGGVAALFAMAGCGGDEAPENNGAAAPAAGGVAPAEQPAPPPQPPQELRLEVDVAAKEVRLFRRDQLEKSYGIAVGTKEWPTQNGSWNVTQVVWNPGWTPPSDEEWAKDEEPKEPGEPDNPLGTVQIVYDPPRTIHGTNEPESIGTAASHGSIRMRNAEAEELAQTLMTVGGAPKDAAWIEQARTNRKVRQEVQLPNPIPIRVINGADDADAVEGERDSEGTSGSASKSSGDGSTRSDTTRSSRRSRSDTTTRRTTADSARS